MWKYTSTDELRHHGILGQKWGQRNGPPYPLESGQKSASEKRTGRKEKIKSGADAIEKKSKKMPTEAEIARRKLRRRIIIGSIAVGTALLIGRKAVKSYNHKAALERKEQAKELKELTASVRELSDGDLDKKVKRLKTEKEYLSLLKKDGSDSKNVSAGRKFVNEFIGEAGKKILVPLAVGGALYGAKAIASKSFDKKEFGEALFNGGPKKK